MGGDEGPFFAQALKGSLRLGETGRKKGGMGTTNGTKDTNGEWGHLKVELQDGGR